ncbi:nucleotidyltransferase family protein [Hydrogenophaga sp.]|uniref:nucleotidyltransferase family protein n=1 Tax=Hydrogenophaga sp. TaxID=1904254 RepID=UPI0019A59ECB|nr:nucleotidyltransferase family protein [Hydrogenophaga sp.]MBD3893821.1 nucleotidyltransferase family protein [Hydrogenophaga sp.]
MLLAAGRGERMRPLTDSTPKPLLRVRGQPLLYWSIQALARGGFSRLVVNTAWLGEQIEQQLSAWQHTRPELQIAFSREGRDFGRALETAGGIARALPGLDEVFWVLAGDVYAPTFVFSAASVQRFAASERLAHLWLVPNPPQHPGGDFGLAADGSALPQAAEQLTYSGIGLYRRALFEPPWCELAPGNPHGVVQPLAALLRAAMAAGRVSAERHAGVWVDVGTPERLAELNAAP